MNEVPADEEREATARRIAPESSKRKNVNIRISQRDLSQIRERDFREGVPYQTLSHFIVGLDASLLHIPKAELYLLAGTSEKSAP